MSQNPTKKIIGYFLGNFEVSLTSIIGGWRLKTINGSVENIKILSRDIGFKLEDALAMFNTEIEESKKSA